MVNTLTTPSFNIICVFVHTHTHMALVEINMCVWQTLSNDYYIVNLNSLIDIHRHAVQHIHILSFSLSLLHTHTHTHTFSYTQTQIYTTVINSSQKWSVNNDANGIAEIPGHASGALWQLGEANLPASHITSPSAKQPTQSTNATTRSLTITNIPFL